MDYDGIVNVVNNLGREDDWAASLAPQGAEHTLDDGTSLWVDEKWGRTYVSVCLDERYNAYRIDAKVQTSLEEYL